MPGEPLIVDASVAVKWIVDEVDSDRAALLLDGRTLHAPDLIFTEVANALWAMRRRGALPPDASEPALAALVRAPLRVEPTRPFVEAALALAGMIDHPVYDCVYLALAVARSAPLVTADRRLVAAARRDPDLAALILPLDSLAAV